MQDVKGAPKPHTAIVDLGYRGVEVPGVEIIHRGRIKSLSAKARRLLRRRQAVEPVIGHLKDDCGLRRNWLKGAARVRQLRSQVLVFARAHFQKCHYNSANCSGVAGFPIPSA